MRGSFAMLKPRTQFFFKKKILTAISGAETYDNSGKTSITELNRCISRLDWSHNMSFYSIQHSTAYKSKVTTVLVSKPFHLYLVYVLSSMYLHYLFSDVLLDILYGLFRMQGLIVKILSFRGRANRHIFHTYI